MPLQGMSSRTCSLASLRRKGLTAIDGKGAYDALHKHVRMWQRQQRLCLAVEQTCKCARCQQSILTTCISRQRYRKVLHCTCL